MKKNSIFTLIELLVVIMIISVLAGMLLPALNKARGKARAIGCANTMRTLGTAAQQYASTYDEYWVPYNLNGMGKWFSSNTAFAELHGLPTLKTYIQYIRKSAVCGERLPPPSDTNVSSATWVSMENVYGIPLCNDQSSGEMQEDTTNAYEYIVFRLNKIRSPSIRFGFMETTNEGRVAVYNSSLAKWIDNGSTAKSTVAAYRHGGGLSLNITFFDGHVECRKYNRVEGTYTATHPNYLSWWIYK